MRYWQIETEANALKTRKLFKRLSAMQSPEYNLILYTASANPIKQQAEFWVKAKNLAPLELNGIVTDIKEIEKVYLQTEVYEKRVPGHPVLIHYHLEDQFESVNLKGPNPIDIKSGLWHAEISLTDRADKIFEFYKNIEEHKFLIPDNSKFRVMKFKDNPQGLDYRMVV